MKKLIGYVGTNDLASVRSEDVKRLDVINVAFGNIINNEIIYEHPESIYSIRDIKAINQNIKVVLSVGGWSSGGFSEAAKTKEGRRQVAKSAVNLIKRYDFDGIDLDWEYPCFSVAGIVGSKEDKRNFTLLIKEIRETLEGLEGKTYMLTIAAGGDAYFIRCTEMKEVQRYLDYVQLMTYDLRGGFQMLTGHHTNLYGNDADLFEASTDKAVKAFIDAGVPKEKLVIGVAFYSREWKGVPDVNNGLLQMAETTGGYGPQYHDLVENFIDKNGYVYYWDDEAKAPYLFNGNHFISYDDEKSIFEKAKYVNNMGLLGVMYWEYGCDRTYRLTKVIRESMDNE